MVLLYNNRSPIPKALAASFGRNARQGGSSAWAVVGVLGDLSRIIATALQRSPLGVDCVQLVADQGPRFTVIQTQPASTRRRADVYSGA